MRIGETMRSVLGVVVLLGLAFAVCWRTTRDLEWPQDHDLYRDMAAAQSFLDEGFGRDACYRGETVWYNPLAPLAGAFAHQLTGQPLRIVFARGGTYLNLLGPLSFVLLAWRLAGGRVALIALSGFLVSVGGAFPSWGAATYSPWLYPVNFAQAFFYLLVLRLVVLGERPLTAGWAIATGLLWGLTFLAHTAPTLIFAALLACHLGAPLWARRREGWAVIRPLVWPVILLGAAAALVVSPFAWSIIGHYRLHIVNPVPNGFVADFLGLRHLPEMILRHLEPPVLVAWYGLYLTVRRRCDPGFRRLVLPWLALTGGVVLYGYVVTVCSKVGIRLPMIVPAFHFLFYFKAAMSLVFGLGLVDLARRLAGWLARRNGLSAERWTPRLAMAMGAALLLYTVPSYLNRYDFVEARREALSRARDGSRIALYEWVRAHARPDDVFLASDDVGLFGVVPAGAKVVAVDPYMSSPYVDVESRRRDRDLMFERLAAGDEAGFMELARRWHVTHVVDETQGAGVAPALRGGRLHEVLARGRMRVYRLAGA